MSDDYRDAQLEVRNNGEESRYEILIDERLAGFAQYRLHNDRITFFHTEVFDEWSGKGLAGRLARYALDDVRALGLVVVPLCPFIAAFIRGHADEYLDLVVPSLRKRVMEG